MPVAPSNDRDLRLPFLLLAALVCALAGLVVAFVVSFRLTDIQFELASISERQRTAVEMIAAANDGVERRTAAAHYRDLIAEETKLLVGNATLQHQQNAERADADLLVTLANGPSEARAFRVLANRISQREDGEVRTARSELGQLHARTVGLATLLAVAALLCAFSGGWLMLRRTRSLESMVRTRTAQIEEVDRSRRLFFAKASHELRTPVTAMRGEAEVALANERADVETLRESLRHLIANATFLSHRINELLGLASADDGKLHLVREPIDLGAIIQTAVGEAAAFAASVEVRISLDCPATLLPAVGDARWLRQAVLAVIDNGLKFSPMGGTLAVRVSREGSLARIAVTDSGPGVMEDDLPRIFDAYYQAEAGRFRGGSGLGLALSRWVAEQHGGTVAAENCPEGGCRITFTLPLEHAA
jgi:signal transduction histidine kinase